MRTALFFFFLSWNDPRTRRLQPLQLRQNMAAALTSVYKEIPGAFAPLLHLSPLNDKIVRERVGRALLVGEP
jgi:hypothetical protein